MSTRGTSGPGGLLVEHEPGFRGYLFELGYSASAAKKHLLLLADLNRWLAREGIHVGELAVGSTEGFFRRRCAQGTITATKPTPTSSGIAVLSSSSTQASTSPSSRSGSDTSPSEPPTSTSMLILVSKSAPLPAPHQRNRRRLRAATDHPTISWPSLKPCDYADPLADCHPS